MKILIHEKKSRLLFYGACIGCFIILSVIFLFRYTKVNENAGVAIISKRIALGAVYEKNGISYLISQPTIEKRYDKEYATDVFHYTIPVIVENNTNEVLSVYDIVSNICVFTGGNVWYGNVVDKENTEIKQSKKHNMIMAVDVIPNNFLDEKVYDDYKIYNVISEKDVINKVEYYVGKGV